MEGSGIEETTLITLVVATAAPMKDRLKIGSGPCKIQLPLNKQKIYLSTAYSTSPVRHPELQPEAKVRYGSPKPITFDHQASDLRETRNVRQKFQDFRNKSAYVDARPDSFVVVSFSN